ncbi:2-aminoethylphosphonate ABC transporter substrate-binding protein [Nocardiopsis sp. HNM0947]|uniref:2-aminoethylphosphonate ABC transporter substrate-binding protein n=1 Tax=Nocardiopsis coralli TaxID=2772213 RepID=A0ABR9P6C9_9ACTN|nr:2-aminoethylphosphonate ABC transporter substrate-binding protein [Nocardiopsis coralli]MBE2999371.1 2-aminoethylphosphonate ABC transporter substrate-binding protein [Nocardiopsis coralli]
MRVRTLAPLTLTAALALTGCGITEPAETITVYAADGLSDVDGDGWLDQLFEDFEEETGVTVQYVEGGSGEMVQRAERESSNPQADVLLTLPPFIQQADNAGLLQQYEPEGAEQVSTRDPDGAWTTVVDNYFAFVHNSEEVDEPPETWEDLLDPEYEGRLQYSTPGVAGDGTAVLIQAMEQFGGLEPAMEYLGDLQENNVGPSSSTGALGPKVDKGELLVANGDVQMNYDQSRTMPNLELWFPAREGGEPTTFALPYTVGLLDGAPDSENGQALIDFLLSEEAQERVPSEAGGFPARDDVEATGEDAEELEEIMDGVEVFEPDWDEVEEELPGYLDAWREATDS